MTLSEKAEKAVATYLEKFGINLPAKQVESTVAKLEDVKLIDGTVLSVDKMEVGSPATFTGEDGVAIPAEGEFELEDGTKIVCASGLVTEIKPKEAEAPVAEVEPVESEMKAMLSKLSERLDAFEKNNVASKTTLEAGLSETKKGLGVALIAISELNEKAVAVNLESQKPSKKATKAYEEMSNYEKMLFNKGKL
jgi:hypothetical protein